LQKSRSRSRSRGRSLWRRGYEAPQSLQFQITAFCKNSTQNSQKLTIFHSGVKKFSKEGHRPVCHWNASKCKNAPFSTHRSKGLGEGAQTSRHWGGVWKGTVKHSNQYNFRLMQFAKMAPRMHQNCTIFLSEVKRFSEGVQTTSQWERSLEMGL